MNVEPFRDEHPDFPTVCGFTHHPVYGSGDWLILAHGAAGNCNSPLLIALATAFSASGIAVFRCDLPFRVARPNERPTASLAARDQSGLKRAVQLMKARASRVYLGGHAYGGHQASLLAASDPTLVAGLLLLSYPLHPPKQSAPLRTQHFSSLRTPAMFVHASKDPFGTPDELRCALDAIPVPTRLDVVENARHELLTDSNTGTLPGAVVSEFRGFFGIKNQSGLVNVLAKARVKT
jgi:predicted alpha/beta-hydrolase family hydrolase